MIKGLAAEDSDQALDRLPRAGLCHLGLLSMKLILVVRSVSTVMALNWATVLRTVLRAVTAANPTASLIMPSERAYDFDALHPVAISNAGDDQSALLTAQ